MIFADASAMIAIVAGEAGADRLADILEADDVRQTEGRWRILYRAADLMTASREALPPWPRQLSTQLSDFLLPRVPPVGRIARLAFHRTLAGDYFFAEFLDPGTRVADCLAWLSANM